MMSSKRAVDLVGASAGLLILSPLMGVLAALVGFRLKRPVLFKQERPGLQGRPFELVQFRTMTEARDAYSQLLPDQDRLPTFGRLLRSTSLDELPELWNVLRGQMSLVGPRPLLMEYLPQYSPRHARRHDVRPGVTDWAQINGRNAPGWEERLEMDVWYVDARSFWLDLRILARTLVTVLGRTGVTQEGHATAAKFRGSDS